MYEFFFNIADYVGIFGVILILVAYFALSTGKMIANTWSYQCLNFLGAWLILYSLFFHWNLSSVIIEIAWIIISIIGMTRCLSKK